MKRDALYNLYGMTGYGGVPRSCGGEGCDVVFRLNAAGNLYGTAAEGGDACSVGCGVGFQVGPKGDETALYSFTGKSDGGVPAGGLVRDKAGNFYGTAAYGGDWSNSTIGCGTVFKLDPEGKEMLPYTFRGDTGGAILKKCTRSIA